LPPPRSTRRSELSIWRMLQIFLAVLYPCIVMHSPLPRHPRLLQLIVCEHAGYSFSVLCSRRRGCVGGCNTMSKSSGRSNSHCISPLPRKRDSQERPYLHGQGREPFSSLCVPSPEPLSPHAPPIHLRPMASRG